MRKRATASSARAGSDDFVLGQPRMGVFPWRLEKLVASVFRRVLLDLPT